MGRIPELGEQRKRPKAVDGLWSESTRRKKIRPSGVKIRGGPFTGDTGGFLENGVDKGRTENYTSTTLSSTYGKNFRRAPIYAEGSGED